MATIANRILQQPYKNARRLFVVVVIFVQLLLLVGVETVDFCGICVGIDINCHERTV